MMLQIVEQGRKAKQRRKIRNTNLEGGSHNAQILFGCDNRLRGTSSLFFIFTLLFFLLFSFCFPFLDFLNEQFSEIFSFIYKYVRTEKRWKPFKWFHHRPNINIMLEFTSSYESEANKEGDRMVMK